MISDPFDALWCSLAGANLKNKQLCRFGFAQQQNLSNCGHAMISTSSALNVRSITIVHLRVYEPFILGASA